MLQAHLANAMTAEMRMFRSFMNKITRSLIINYESLTNV
jgi:hypothetical protein